jgi:hypothetical protein
MALATEAGITLFEKNFGFRIIWYGRVGIQHDIERALCEIAEVSWSRFVGQFGGFAKVYSGC